MARGKKIKPAKEITINEQATIKMRNEVVNGRYHLPLLEMRMLMALAAHVKKNADEFDCYSISASELGRYMGLNDKTQYTTIRKLARSLRKRELFFEWFARPESKRKSWLTTGWFDYILYDEEHATLEFQFASKIEPMLLQVQEAYVQLRAKPLMAFNCSYSNRLLMLIMEWEKIQPRQISIEELRDMFQLLDKYKMFNDFKRFVIDPAIKEINALSDFSVKFTPIKTGRSYTHIKFFIKRKVRSTIDVEPVDNDNKLPSDWVDWQRDIYNLLTNAQYGISDDDFLIPYISKEDQNTINANIEYAKQQQSEGKVRNWPAFLRMALENNYGFNFLISQREQKLAEEKRRNMLLIDPLTGELTREGVLAEQTTAYKAEQEEIKKHLANPESASKATVIEQAKIMYDKMRKNNS